MIRKAKMKDATIVAKLAIEMWGNHENEELTEEFEAVIASSEGAVFLYEIENKEIGFAQCQLRHDYVEGTESSPVGYLEGIFVNEKYRKQGIAKELLQECEKWSIEMGCKEFASDCELTNEESLKFHLGMGFTEANRIICFTKQL